MGIKDQLVHFVQTDSDLHLPKKQIYIYVIFKGPLRFRL